MAGTLYNRGKYVIAKNDMSTADLRMLLMNVWPAGCEALTLNTVADLLGVATAAECAGTGYARKDLAGVSCTEDDGNNRVNIDFTGPVFTGANFNGDKTVQAIVIYLEGGGTDATRDLIMFDKTNLPVTTNGGDLTIDTPNDAIRAS